MNRIIRIFFGTIFLTFFGFVAYMGITDKKGVSPKPAQNAEEIRQRRLAKVNKIRDLQLSNEKNPVKSAEQPARNESKGDATFGDLISGGSGETKRERWIREYGFTPTDAILDPSLLRRNPRAAKEMLGGVLPNQSHDGGLAKGLVIHIKSHLDFTAVDAAGGRSPRTVNAIIREFGKPDEFVPIDPPGGGTGGFMKWTRYTFVDQETGKQYRELSIPLNESRTHAWKTGMAYLK